jgi:hypothetical protein
MTCWPFPDNLNFVAGFQIPSSGGFCAHALDSSESVFLLQSGSFAESGSPGNILGEIIEDRRELGESLNSGIPGWLFDGALKSFAGQVRIAFEEVIGFHHLIGIGRSAENLCDERIGINCDGGDDPVEIAIGEFGVFFLGVESGGRKILRDGEEQK